MLKLFNTLTRRVELFTPLKKIVTLYSCGPTVYHHIHIGNYRTFLSVDLLKRVLGAAGYRVKHIMNITDVGHLVGDGDTGEDKIEVGARREHKTAWDIARQYEKIFRAEMKSLNTIPPFKWPRATAHIKEQIALIRVLEKKGYTYRTPLGIYFDSTRYKKYGALAGSGAQKNISGALAGARVAMDEKKHPTDFALWKFSPADATRHMEWNSPWGRGFPGWHIECSAMAMKYLGPTIDIHAGATDLIPVHHTNEIAQSECATGKPFARFWVHGAFVLVNEEKMAKSAGNFTTLADIVVKNFSPLDFKYLTLQTHYRKELRFSFDALAGARTARQHLIHAVTETRAAAAPHAPTLKKIHDAFMDDLNAPEALGALWQYLGSAPPPAEARATILAADVVFGLGLAKEKKKSAPATVRTLLKKRAAARDEKNWALADELRNAIRAHGFEVRDTATGQEINPVLY